MQQLKCGVFCDEGVFTLDETQSSWNAQKIRVVAFAFMPRRSRTPEQLASPPVGWPAPITWNTSPMLMPPRCRPLTSSRVTAESRSSLRTFEFGQVKRSKEAGVELALATDCNPGTSW